MLTSMSSLSRVLPVKAKTPQVVDQFHCQQFAPTISDVLVERRSALGAALYQPHRSQLTCARPQEVMPMAVPERKAATDHSN